MRNYPGLFEQANFFSWSLFYTFHGLEENPFNKRDLEKLKLLDDCLKDYCDNSDALTKADLELLDRIEQMLLKEWSPKYGTYNHLCDLRIMAVCEVYMKLSDDLEHKQFYIKYAADYAKRFESKVDPLASVESQTRIPLILLNRAVELLDMLPEENRSAMEKYRADIRSGIEKLEHFDLVVAARRKEYEEDVRKLMDGKEVHEGNEVIKRYISGSAWGRMQWIRYFYTECTDPKVIEKNCEELFGGYNEDDAEGYIGAYTLLKRVPISTVVYWAGFNYSFEQMEANYD